MKQITLTSAPAAEDSLFSLSLSDLMAALLLVFILILSVTLAQLAEDKRHMHDTEQELKQKKRIIEKRSRELEQQKLLNEKRLGMISEQEKAKRSIIKQLMGEWDQNDIEVVQKTGAIRVKDSILFEFNSANLKIEGKKFLRNFFPKYTGILLKKDEIRDQIAQIIIEGHTDNKGSYRHNLKLSLARANSVASYIYSNEFPDFDLKYQLKDKLSVNGRSFVSPIADNSTNVGRTKNRRVEFKFSFKDWTTLQNGKITILQNDQFKID